MCIRSAENKYNALGQLIRTKLHQTGGNEAIDSVKYAYNIRGHATDIRGHWFSEKLHYNDAAGGLGNADLWNGNISAAEWNAPAKGAEWHAYKYAYDKLGRLKKAEYARSATVGTGYGADAGFYNTNYEYDLSGNITELNRKHENTKIDALTFSYPEGNRLAQITDGANNILGFDGTSNYT